jgi:anti-sigma B factor antagonist
VSAATPEGAGRPASLTVELTDGVVVLRIGGELDLLTVPDLRHRLDEATATTGPVVVDLSDVRFLSSAGLHLLISVHAELAASDRPLRLVTGGTRAVIRPLQITGLDRFLRLYPDLPSAMTTGGTAEKG